MLIVKTVCSCGVVFKTEEDYLTKGHSWRFSKNRDLWFNCQCRSSHIIRHGYYQWYIDQLFKVKPTLFAQILNHPDMPYMKSSIFDLKEVVSDDRSSASEIEAALLRHPGICFRLLEIANNLRSDTGHNIESLTHAVAFVGRKQIFDIILVAAMREFKFKTTFYNDDVFWAESFLIGHITEYLRQALAPNLSSHAAYLTGLLCNLGKVVAAICFPEKVDLIAREYYLMESPLNWLDLEKKHKLYAHTALGEIAAGIWGMPEQVIIIAAEHHASPPKKRLLYQKDPNKDSVAPKGVLAKGAKEAKEAKEGLKLDVLVPLANMLRHKVENKDYRINQELYRAYCARAGVRESDLSEIAQEIRRNRPTFAQGG